MEYWTVPKAGVYLVFDNSYQVIGVASGDRAGWTRFGSEDVTVVGPVPLDQPIDWDTTREEQYGINFGPVADYNEQKDGVPLPPQSTYEDFGHPLR
jgi:hypothetical protein